MSLVRGRDNILPRDYSMLQGRAGRARESGFVDPCGVVLPLTGPRPARVRDYEVRPLRKAPEPKVIEDEPEKVQTISVWSPPPPQEAKTHDDDIIAFYDCQGVDVQAPKPSSSRDAWGVVRDEATGVSRMPMRAVLALVERASGIAAAAIIGPQRHAPIVRARQAVMFLAVVASGRSFPDCGRRLGGRDHTTALWGYQQTCKRLGLPARGIPTPAHVRAAWAMIDAMKTGGGLDEAMAAGAAAAQDFDGASERIENVERSRNWGKRTP